MNADLVLRCPSCGCDALADDEFCESCGLALGVLHAQDGIDEWALAVGGGGGAVVGFLIVVYATRPRPQR